MWNLFAHLRLVIKQLSGEKFDARRISTTYWNPALTTHVVAYESGVGRFALVSTFNESSIIVTVEREGALQLITALQYFVNFKTEPQ